MRNRLAIAILGAAITAAGCGGGGTSATTPVQTGTQTVQLGPAQVSFASQPTTQIGVTGQTVSVYGMAGSTFPDVIVDPPQTLSNTEILFTGSFGTGGLWTYANGQASSIGGISLVQVASADWTHDGHIIYVAYDSVSAAYQIFECNYDGSSSHRITNSTHVSKTSRAVWSPLNNLIAYDDGAGDIYTAGTTGAGETLRVDGGSQPCFSPNGQSIAFEDSDTNTISSIPTNGGTISPIASNESGPTYPLPYPNYSPDGNYVIFTAYAANPVQPEIFSLQGSSVGFVVSTAAANSASFSPDGSQVAYILTDIQLAGYQSLVTSSFTGSNLKTLVPPTVGMMAKGPSWSPFPGPQRFVAATVGTLLPSASGFLFGQAGDSFGGFVAFTAKTPVDAVITSEGTPTGTAPYSFDIHADEVTSLKFTNGLYSAVNTVSTGNYSDVVVSVSGITGQISFIAPVLQKRTNGALAKQVITHSDGNTVYRGSFAGLYDAKGKNLAPSGLSQFRLDSKGKLIDFK